MRGVLEGREEDLEGKETAAVTAAAMDDDDWGRRWERKDQGKWGNGEMGEEGKME